MSRRYDIQMAYVKLLNDKLDGVNYLNVYENVSPILVFWDEINSYPFISATLGDEVREYDTGGIKWGYASLSVRIYVKEEEHGDSLNQFLEDIENIIEAEQGITYNDNGDTTFETTVQSITTDQGVLAPVGVGELSFLIKYPLPSAVCCGPATPYPCG